MNLKFALALLDNGIINMDQFVELCRSVERTRSPLTAYVLGQASMTLRQVQCVFDFQQIRPGMTFGQAALELGFIEAAELRRLETAAAENHRSFSDVAVQRGLCSRGQSLAICRALEMNVNLSQPRESVKSPKFRKLRKAQVAKEVF